MHNLNFRHLAVSIFVFLCAYTLLAQDQSKLASPDLVEVTAGREVVFKVEGVPKNNKDFSFSWDSDITDASFDEQEQEFYWQSSYKDVGVYKANFYVKDSFGVTVSSSQTIIKIQKTVLRPSIRLMPDSLENAPFISLEQGTEYELEFVAISKAQRDVNDVLLTYLLNNDGDLKTLEDASFNLVGNRLIVRWKPNERQAKKRYFDLEVVAIDQRNMVTRKKYRFQIIDKNLPPKLKHSINDQYIIVADQRLQIDFGVEDPDGDPIQYAMNIPVNIGSPNISMDGQFSWYLSTRDMASIANLFPIEIVLKASEIENDSNYVEKHILLYKSEQNYPPVITKLSNLSIREGYSVKRRVFIEDNNHALSDLTFSLENEPEWLYIQQEGDKVYLMSDTVGFDIVKADGIPVHYDVLFSVTDSQGAGDQKFFNVTVNEGINTVKVYHELDQYQKQTDALLVGLRKTIRELDKKIQGNARAKKAFLYTSFVLGTFSATGAFFDDHTIVKKAIPYSGAVLAISSSINALAFNQEGKMTSLKVKLEEIEKGLVRNKSYLKTYDIKDESDEELRNNELVNRLRSYRQALIEQRIELQKLNDDYRELNYVQRRAKRARRKGRTDGSRWGFIQIN